MNNSIVFFPFFLHFIVVRLNSVKSDISPWPVGLHDWWAGVSLVVGPTRGLEFMKDCQVHGAAEVASASLSTCRAFSFSSPSRVLCVALPNAVFHFYSSICVCLVLEIPSVTCELAKSSCLTACTSPLQNLVNVPFCVKPCYLGGNEIRRRRSTSEWEQCALWRHGGWAFAGHHLPHTQHMASIHGLQRLFILEKYGRRVALLGEEWLFRHRSSKRFSGEDSPSICLLGELLPHPFWSVAQITYLAFLCINLKMQTLRKIPTRIQKSLVLNLT